MISDEERDAAIGYLGETRERAAIAIAVEKAEYEVERRRAKAFLEASGPVEERKAWAIMDGAHQDAIAEYLRLKEIEIEAAKREQLSILLCSQYQTDAKDRRYAQA